MKDERGRKTVYKKTGGRNNTGRITVRHRGGGSKRKIRELEKEERTGKVIRIEYDPNRTAYLGECITYKGRRVYKILVGEDSSTKKEGLVGRKIEVKEIGQVEQGTIVNRVGLREGEGGKLGRAAGVSCKIIKQEKGRTIVRMPSKEVKEISGKSNCTIGAVLEERKERGKTAGAERRRGIRPTVRGVAMNAVDHPHGGKTQSGQPKTPWGKLAKWIPTRKARLIRR